MKPPSARWSFVITLPTAQQQLLMCAAVVGVVLLSIYVHLLHESISLGEQLRERQRTTASTTGMKSTPRPLRIGAVQQHNLGDTQSTATR